MRGRINLFSLDTLIDMAATAGLAPSVTIKKPKGKKAAHQEALAA
jgi:predicted XRE-type DNA-binding protein